MKHFCPIAHCYQHCYSKNCLLCCQQPDTPRLQWHSSSSASREIRKHYRISAPQKAQRGRVPGPAWRPGSMARHGTQSHWLTMTTFQPLPDLGDGHKSGSFFELGKYSGSSFSGPGWRPRSWPCSILCPGYFFHVLISLKPIKDNIWRPPEYFNLKCCVVFFFSQSNTINHYCSSIKTWYHVRNEKLLTLLDIIRREKAWNVLKRRGEGGMLLLSVILGPGWFYRIMTAFTCICLLVDIYMLGPLLDVVRTQKY